MKCKVADIIYLRLRLTSKFRYQQQTTLHVMALLCSRKKNNKSRWIGSWVIFLQLLQVTEIQKQMHCSDKVNTKWLNLKITEFTLCFVFVFSSTITGFTKRELHMQHITFTGLVTLKNTHSLQKLVITLIERDCKYWTRMR